MTQEARDISSRFRKLLVEFSQAEIARTCEIPPSNLSRYANGQRIPAEVCSKLVRHLGVSATWLLTGEGSMFGVESGTVTQEATSGLRQLLDLLSQSSVRALDSVPRALEGTSLADLRRGFSELTSVQEQLQGGMGQLYQDLLDELVSAMDDYDRGRAEQVLQQLRDLETICPQPEYVRQRRNLEAVVLLESNRLEEALAIQRSIFIESMGSFEEATKPQLMQEFNFIATLRACGYLLEARAYARALAELRKPLESQPEYWLLRVVGAFLEIELGELSQGLELLSKSLAHVPASFQRENYSLVICAHMLQGTLTLESARVSEASRVEALPENERLTSAVSLLRFALCEGATATIVRVWEDFGDLRQFQGWAEDPCLQVSEAIVQVSKGTASAEDALSRVLRAYQARVDSAPAASLTQVEHCCAVTRFALLHSLAHSVELWEESETAIASLDERQSPRLLTRWLHASNTLRLGNQDVSPDLEKAKLEATRFLQEYASRGYVALVPNSSSSGRGMDEE